MGVIYHVPLTTTKEDIFNNDSNVTIQKVRRITSLKDGKLQDTTSVELTFADCRPQQLIISGNVFDVSQYFPPPKRCKTCWRLGHTTSMCSAKIPSDNVCCKFCADIHESVERCSRPLKCINCNGKHPSDHVDCPAYRERRAAIRLSITEHITIKAALSRSKQPKNASNGSMVSAPEWTASATAWPLLPSKEDIISKVVKDIDDLKMAVAPMSSIQDRLRDAESHILRNEKRQDAQISQLQQRMTSFEALHAVFLQEFKEQKEILMQQFQVQKEFFANKQIVPEDVNMEYNRKRMASKSVEDSKSSGMSGEESDPDHLNLNSSVQSRNLTTSTSSTAANRTINKATKKNKKYNYSNDGVA